MFRNEKPGPGRFRQFMQFDADTVGSASPAADAEMCMMMADTMEALGIPRGEYVVKVNNRKVLDGCWAAGVDDAGQKLTVLRAIDKLDRLGTRNLPYAKVTSPEDPPLRPERHVPNSIATMRRRLVAALATTLSRCPCCAARNGHQNL